MNYELFIARKIIFGKENSARVAAPVIRIAIAGVALGLALMIVAVAVVTGFQKEIREKVIGFGGHIQITPLDLNSSFEKKPLDLSQLNLDEISKADPNIIHYQVFATKAGIIKTEKEIEGVVLKGIGVDFDWNFFKKNLIEGTVFNTTDSATSNETMISKITASKLNLKTGDEILLYFVQQPPRMRKLKISGIYETGLEEFDKIYALCDIRHIRKLNNWSETQAAGIELFLNDFEKCDESNQLVNSQLGYNTSSKTIRQLNPQVFDWLGLQDMNAVIIIGLIILVCGMNMISALLILILERTKTIGILKSLGASDRSIRKIFLFVATGLLSFGILIGNILGYLLCFIQAHYSLIKLDQQSYYIPSVPIHFSSEYFMMLNAGTIMACVVFLIIPTSVISRISPVKAVRF